MKFQSRYIYIYIHIYIHTYETRIIAFSYKHYNETYRSVIYNVYINREEGNNFLQITKIKSIYIIGYKISFSHISKQNFIFAFFFPLWVPDSYSQFTWQLPFGFLSGFMDWDTSSVSEVNNTRIILHRYIYRLPTVAFNMFKS